MVGGDIALYYSANPTMDNEGASFQLELAF